MSSHLVAGAAAGVYTPRDSLDEEYNDEGEVYDDVEDPGEADEEYYDEESENWQQQLLQQKVYVDYPHEKEDDNEYRFVSSRIGDDFDDDENVGGAYGLGDAGIAHLPHQKSLPQRQRQQQHPRYQAMDLSPTGEFSHRHGVAAEPLPVYGLQDEAGDLQQPDVDEAAAADQELAGEIRYQAEMQRRLDQMANQVAKLDKQSVGPISGAKAIGGGGGSVPRLDLLHMEEATASQQHLYRDSLDIDLRDNDTEETDDDEADQHHPKPHQHQHQHSSKQQPQDLSSNRRAEIDHVTRLSRQLGGLQIEPDYYDSGRNPPSESIATDTTGRSAAAAAAANAMPTAEDLEFLRKLKRDMVYGGQAGPHQQLMRNEGSPIQPDSLRQPLPQVQQQQPINKQSLVKQRPAVQQKQPQPPSQPLDKDFVEENKKLPTNRLPTKSYGKIYREKREKPKQKKYVTMQQPLQQQKQQQHLEDSLEVTQLDDQSPPEQVWMSRMAALQSVGSGGSQQRKSQAAATSKQTSADPRLQKLQQQQKQEVPAENQRHSVPADRMLHGADAATLARAEAYWPYQQAHYVTAYDINGQPVTVPVAGPPPAPPPPPPQAFVYPYQPYPVYGVPPVQMPPQPQQQQHTMP
uniref:SH2 domain-containing protein n=1 Tax=Macrostomum lignano TaxID=282301 RepID=A0A1I8GY83_9PLAT